MPFSDLFSPVSLSGVMQRLGLEPTHKDRPAWSYSTRYKEGVDARLTGILSTAAERFAAEHPGYTVEATSGKNARASGTRWHPGGIATDVQITDPTGKKLGNYQDPESFRTYEAFAQTARAVQKETHPELDNNFAWGGYYGGRFAADQMHFDLGPTRGTLGSWEGGLNKAGKNFLPGAVSIGMGQLGGFSVDAVPTPTPRPDPLDPANMPPDTTFGSLGPMFGSRQMHPDFGLQSIQDQREYERPSFAAPLGQVERSALADVPQAAQDISAMDIARQAVNAPVDTMGGMGTAATQGALGGFLGQQAKQGLGSMFGAPGAPVGPQSLAPNHQMPSGPVNVSTDFAPPTSNIADLAGLQAIQDQREYERAPDRRFTPDLMGPPQTLNAPAPAFTSPPTEVSNNNVISPTPGAPASSVIDPTGQFPDAPAEPSTWDHVKYAGKPVVRDAMLGLKLGGPLGALGVAGIGALGRNLGISLGPGFDNAAPDRFSVGSGLQGIMSAMGGKKGAQGFSLSNPGMSFTSLGPGMGGLRRSDKYGWTEHVNDAGSVVGISYDNPKDKGLLGRISSSMKDKFGGGISDKERSSFSGKAGLW